MQQSHGLFAIAKLLVTYSDTYVIDMHVFSVIHVLRQMLASEPYRTVEFVRVTFH